MQKQKFVSGIATLVSLLMLSGVASAEYICSINYRGYSSNMGTAGHVAITTYTGQGCTGAFVATRNVCTTGATSTGCASAASFQRSETAFLAELRMIEAATRDDQNVGVSTTACNGGAASCLASIWFYSN